MSYAIRRLRWALAAFVMVAGLAVGGLATASPASAASCATRGHAYLTVPVLRQYIFSGYEADYSVGVRTVNIDTGQTSSYVNTGGNGIRPGTSVTFNLFRTDGGTTFVKGIQTRTANSSCVVNEQRATVLDGLDPGQYVLTATYFAGNSGAYISNESVVLISVQAPPPPPVCVYDPDAGATICY